MSALLGIGLVAVVFGALAVVQLIGWSLFWLLAKAVGCKMPNYLQFMREV